MERLELRVCPCIGANYLLTETNVLQNYENTCKD